MSEKLHEQHLRKEKVEALKARLLGDICLELQQELFVLRSLTERESNMNPRYVRESIDKMHNLYALEDRIKHDDGLLMRFSYSDEEQDVIIYTVEYDTLEWMCQNNHLLSQILFAVETSGVPINNLLSDEFFEHRLFGFFERREWKNQRAKEVDGGKMVDKLIGEATERSSAAQFTGNNMSKDECLIKR